MTTYKEIFGKQIKQLSSDLTDAESEGQIWFNTTEGAFKTIVSAGAWSSGANLNTAGGGSGFGATINASARVLGPTLVTEEYNGSSWTTVNPASSAQGGFFGGSTSGTQTAAYIVGGRRASPEVDFGTTSTYDGTNWTAAPGSISPGRIGASAHGTQTAGIAAAGAQSGVAGVLASTATFNGTAWTGAPSLGVARGQTDSIHGGTQTATITVSGERSPSGDAYNLHEQYDGSSWTAKTVMTSGGAFVSGSGGQDSYVAYAGSSSPAPSGDGNGAVTNRTIAWDGTAWTTQGSMAIANRYRASLATITSNSSALAAGGATPSNITSTEEYALSIFSPIAATWASTTSTPTPSGYNSGASGGTSTAGFMAGGQTAPNAFTNLTFNFDGTSWTGSGNMGDARIRINLGVSGTQTAGLGVGGYSPGVVTSVEEYDGSNWSGGGALPTATQQSGGAGPQTNYMMLGTDSDRSEGLSYNGSAWGSEGSSSQGFAYGALTGQETSALAFYGATSPAGTSRSTGEEYNGTAWTTVVPSLPNQGSSGGAGGTSTASVFAGNSTTARYWDGTTVAATASMATARGNYYSIGSSADGFIAASGSSPGVTRNTEQYNAESQALNTKTLTSS